MCPTSFGIWNMTLKIGTLGYEQPKYPLPPLYKYCLIYHIDVDIDINFTHNYSEIIMMHGIIVSG